MYYNKYLKYKSKYINLKKQFGGDDEDDINEIIKVIRLTIFLVYLAFLYLDLTHAYRTNRNNYNSNHTYHTNQNNYNSNDMELYNIMELPKNATPDEINKQYKKLCRKYHPDKNLGNPDYSDEKIKLINKANEVLSDPRLRGLYDIYGLYYLKTSKLYGGFKRINH